MVSCVYTMNLCVYLVKYFLLKGVLVSYYLHNTILYYMCVYTGQSPEGLRRHPQGCQYKGTYSWTGANLQRVRWNMCTYRLGGIQVLLVLPIKKRERWT